MKSIIVALAGGTGSGKTSVANGLKDHFKDDLTIIHYDDYYKSLKEGEKPEDVNWDHPDSLNRKQLYNDILCLSEGKTINKPIYDFIDSKAKTYESVEPTKIILVDGIFSLYDNDLNSLYDLKIYVDMDSDLRILRRTQRDIDTRGRKIESIMKQYIKTVKDSHNLYVEPQKWYSDFVIPNNIERTFPKIEEVIILLEYKVKNNI